MGGAGTRTDYGEGGPPAGPRWPGAGGGCRGGCKDAGGTWMPAVFSGRGGPTPTWAPPRLGVVGRPGPSRLELRGGIATNASLGPPAPRPTGCTRVNVGTAALENLGLGPGPAIAEARRQDSAVGLDVRGTLPRRPGWTREGREGWLEGAWSGWTPKGARGLRLSPKPCNKDGMLSGPEPGPAAARCAPGNRAAPGWIASGGGVQPCRPGGHRCPGSRKGVDGARSWAQPCMGRWRVSQRLGEEALKAVGRGDAPGSFFRHGSGSR